MEIKITIALSILIVLVIFIDLILNRKKQSSVTEIEKYSFDKRKLRFVIKPIIISVSLIIILFTAINYYLFDGKLTDNDDNISLLQNITLDKIYLNDIIVSDSMWVDRSTLQKLNCIVLDSLGNYNGVIIDGYQEGQWSYYYPNGNLRAKVNFLKGNGLVNDDNGIPYNGRNGTFLKWHENGQLAAKKEFRNGYSEGESKVWYENGKLASQSIFFNGKPIEEKGYYKNGNLRVSNIRSENKLELKRYYENGQIEKLYKKNDSSLIEIRWYKNGIKQYEDIINERMKTSVFSEWFENGQIFKQVNYLHNIPHGESLHWWQNGNLKFKRNYVHGKEHGAFFSWFENGKISTETLYDNGKLIDTEIYRY